MQFPECPAEGDTDSAVSWVLTVRAILGLSLRSKVRSSGGVAQPESPLWALLWRFYLMCPRRPASVRLSTEIKEFKKSPFMEALRNASSCATGSAATHCLKVLDGWVGLFWLKRFPWWSDRPLSVLLLWGVVCGWSAARGDQRLEGRFHCQVTWDDRHSLLLSERGEAWSPLFHLDSLLRNKKVDVLRHSDPPSPMNLSSSCVSPACSSTFILPSPIPPLHTLRPSQALTDSCCSRRCWGRYSFCLAKVLLDLFFLLYLFLFPGGF